MDFLIDLLGALVDNADNVADILPDPGDIEFDTPSVSVMPEHHFGSETGAWFKND